MPGAAVLAATAALRSGAGKLTIATGASVAQAVALAVPEARVIALAETPAGGMSPPSEHVLIQVAHKFDAVLIGPGMQDEASTCELVAAVLRAATTEKTILDAYAMSIVREPQPDGDAHCGSDLQRIFMDRFGPQGGPVRQAPQVLFTPHAGEMAHLTAATKESVVAEPCSAARSAAARWRAVVALKGACTYIASAQGQVWSHVGGNNGLAISGSGDTLAGIIAGLAARGASLEQAAAWGVTLHARAGEELARRVGPLGYLARELAAEVPALMVALGAAA